MYRYGHSYGTGKLNGPDKVLTTENYCVLKLLRRFILVGLFGIHLLSCVSIYLLYRGTFYLWTFLDCTRYNEDFVISRFCSIHCTVTLAGLNNIVRYTEDFVT